MKKRGWPAGLLAGLALSPLLSAAGQDPKPPAETWRIKGQLSEACTCSVPCTCNFGERPSPHEYCYAMWSYWIKEGRFREVELKDIHLGGVEGPGGTLALLDVRARPEQRQAMEEITQSLIGRLLCLVRLWPLKASAAGLGSRQVSSPSTVLHTSYQDRRFLGFEYVEIVQQVTEREARVRFGDRGGFEAVYLFGRDPSRPITVGNIVSWPIALSIKGKTTYFKYQDRHNQLDYRGTNANQGDFDLSSADPGARPMNPPK
jgi:hypothetical protein